MNVAAAVHTGSLRVARISATVRPRSPWAAR